MDPKPLTDFDKEAQESMHLGLVRELWQFLCHNKKWWLLPILVLILLLAGLLALSGSAATPFIYTLF